MLVYYSVCDLIRFLRYVPIAIYPSGMAIRIDKWLWAARFFKTRSTAQQAIEGGKVKLNGERTKPARDLKVGDTLVIPIKIEVKGQASV